MERICRQICLYALLAVLIVFVSCTSSRKSEADTVSLTDKKNIPVYNELSHNDQLRFNYFFLESENQQNKGNLTAAFDLLNHCLSIDSCASEAYYKQAQYYLQLKKDSLAQISLEKAVRGDKDNSYYNDILAQLYMHSEKFDKAIDVYEHLYDINYNRADVLEILLQLYNKKGDYKNAISTLNRMESIIGGNERISMAKAQIYSEQGKKKDAYNEILNLSKEHPNDLNFRTLLGDWLMENGKEKESLEIYNRVLKEEPQNVMAQMSMLSYYKTKGLDSLANRQLNTLLFSDKTDASDRMTVMRDVIADNERKGCDSTVVLNLFKNLFKSSKADANLYILCGVYMNEKKMPHDSIAKVLGKVIEIAPDNAASRLQLIQYAWEKKDYNKAIELCKPALEYNPDEMAFYYYLGMAYYLNNDLNNALSTFKKGTSTINSQSDPSLVSDYYGIMGDIFHAKGEPQSSFAAYDSCLQWKDDNIVCLNNYAYYLSEKGVNLDKAEKMSLKVVKSEPKNSTYLDTYAWILFMQKRYAEAKIYIDQAVRNDSDKNGVILEHAGDIYAMNNDIQKALVYWTDSAKISKDDNKLLYKKIKFKKYLRK